MKRSNRRSLTAILLTLVVALYSPGISWAATAIYVDINTTEATEDGTQQFPFRSIQQAINAAVSGDRVLVAPGTYFESISVADGVNIFGAGSDQTTIDGSMAANSVVTFNQTRFNPRFDGFTIRGGSGDFIGFLAGVPINVGGGIRINSSGPIVTNNVIIDNVIDEGIARGAGVYINTTLETPQLLGNTIMNNIARSTDGGAGESRGGGIFIQSKVTSALVTENIIELNVSDVGGGIYNKNLGTASLNVERNVFRQNEATDGAAIFTTSFSNSSATISNNLFLGNGSDAGFKDCDDVNGSSTPGGGEICNDGIDNDCDPMTPDIFDGDNDGSPCDIDCDDSDPMIGPHVPENCSDMIDNDCDGNIDVSNPDNITLVEFGSDMTFLGNDVDPGIGTSWTDAVFDDGSWTPGTYGVGYENNSPGAEALFGATVASGTSSIYTRTLFEIGDISDVNAMFLGADYDDGYVAWINGVEVFRSVEMPAGAPAWNTGATNGESSNGTSPDYGLLNDISTPALPALVNGTNVLAIGVWNDLPGSSDLVLVPRLSISLGMDDSECLCGDVDGDGYSCTDCDDTEPTTNPMAPELCNDTVDNDCDVATPDIFDRDADSFNCVIDCDDNAAEVNPSAMELYCDGVDNDCNAGTPDVVDLDNDFADCTIDCNDNSPSIFPGQLEFCFDGIDNNCDGFIDDQDLECSCANPVDADADSYRCTDCNDSVPGINPGVAEVCNDGIDNDCNASTPDLFDGDGDGETCDLDCQDFDPSINTAAIEICNDMIDNDCDMLTDGADPECSTGDADGDGYDASVDCADGDPNVNPGATEICNDGLDNDCDPATLDLTDADMDGFDCTTDCDDTNPLINPSAPEDCADRIDNNCDGLVDAAQFDLSLVEFGSEMKFLANNSDPGFGIAWRNVIFNDAPWPSGLYGVGYQFGIPGSGVEDLVATTVPEDTASVYTRALFEITNIGSVNALYIGADYDDGYVAWINGVEVYRSPEMPAGIPTWDADPMLHESSNGQVPDYGTLIDISGVGMPALVEGTNLLAVGVYNDLPDGGGNSSDLVVVPRLAMDFGDDDPDCLCADMDGDGYSCSDCDDMDPNRNPGIPEIGCDSIDNDCDAGTPDLADVDGDGFFCDVDCDDMASAVFPGQFETPCDFINNDCDAGTPDLYDADLDGFDCQTDCDETDPMVNPGQPEIGCDGLDNDCNTLTADVADADFDGFRCDQDCDDDDPLVNPSVFEKCDDGIDNDCDTFIDDMGDTDCACPDVDTDGYQCQDCNDGDPLVNPAVLEICNDGIDNDCDVATLDVGDADGDGFDCLNDCDDTNPFIRPNAVELCNDGIDNDCDPMTLDIVDADMDSFTCDVDCNDNDSLINPGIVEVCNDTIDNDCNPSTVDIGDLDFDGSICTFDCDDQNDQIGPNVVEVCNDGIDNDCNPLTLDLFDGDGDGSTCDLDCDDADPARGTGVAERCDDGIDNDCDGDTDGADADCGCADGDNDGYACLDCNDGDPAINPEAAEVCNDTVDNDCNPATLDIDDLDGDGFTCDQECDDTDPLAFPSGVEICGDGIDNDCNPGTPDLVDADVDGFLCDVDCDDSSTMVNPGQVEIGCDGLDNDCDPMTSDLTDEDMDGFTCVDGSVRGGAVTANALSTSAKVTIVNNTFIGNGMPSGIGGAIYLDDIIAADSAVVANNIFQSNEAELGGALVHTFFFGDLANNAFNLNLPADLYDAGGSGMTRNLNLFGDPEFANLATENYRLDDNSPLIDAGDPSVAPVNDFDRVERPFDGDFDLSALPDIGAFEYPSGEVLDVVYTGKDALSWRVDDVKFRFNIYRGALTSLRGQGIYTQAPFLAVPEQFCAVQGVTLPFGDGYTPAAGAVVFYLVTFKSLSYEGSLGNDSEGRLRPNENACP